MAIYDTMNFIKPNVSTVCIGQAASMGAFLLSAGEKGKRYCLPNSRVMNPSAFRWFPRDKRLILKFMLKRFYLLKRR